MASGFDFPLALCTRCGADEMDAFDCMADDCEFAILGRYRDEAAKQAHCSPSEPDAQDVSRERK